MLGKSRGLEGYIYAKVTQTGQLLTAIDLEGKGMASESVIIGQSVMCMSHNFDTPLDQLTGLAVLAALETKVQREIYQATC
jgi:hypothetical protein